MKKPWILTLLLLFTLSANAGAATISGKVDAAVKAEKTKPAASYSRGAYVPAAQKSSSAVARQSKIVVWAEPLEAKAPFVKLATVPQVIQQDKTFFPHVLVVQTGTTVAFPNIDPLYHNVFSYSRTKRFDLGRYQKGKAKQVTFDKPGLVEVFCEIHEDMHSYILVLDTPYFARTDKDGQYSLQAPVGPYRLLAWTPTNGKSQPLQVELTQAGLRADLSF